MIRSFITYFFGSTPDDFEPVVDTLPFAPCPDLSNCTCHAVQFNKEASELFEITLSAMGLISPYKMDADSHSLQIDVVFRIPVLGFKDDVKIIIKPEDNGDCILYIKSSSRIGESDLGVNRRRIQRILSIINQQML